MTYPAKGFMVAAMACRGQGVRSEDAGGHKETTQTGQIICGLDGTSDNLLFSHIFLDTAQLYWIVMAMPEVDETCAGVMGAVNAVDCP